MVNIRNKRHTLCVFMAAVLLLLFVGWTDGMAAEHSPAAVIEDLAGLLSAEDKEQLSAEAQAIAEETGFNMIVGTCAEAEGRSVREVADDFFDASANGEDGVSCIIDMDNREIAFRAYGEAILYLPENEIDGILDQAAADIQDGAYADCLYTMIRGTYSGYVNGIPDGMRIYDEDTGKTYVYDAEDGKMQEISRLEPIEICFAGIAAVIAAVLVYVVIVGKYKLKWGTYHYDFHNFGKLVLTKEEDRFVNQVVTRRHIPKSNGNSLGGGHSSSVSRGAGGRISSGGSRKF